MSALGRIGHSLKGRVQAAVVVVSDGHAGFIQGRQSTSVKFQYLHSTKLSYNHLLSQSVVLSRCKQNDRNDGCRSLRTNTKDNIDEESGLPLTHSTKGVLVYTGRMTQYVKGLKTLSLSTSLLALLAQPMVLSAAKDDLIFKAGVMGSISAVVFCTPALVHFVTKKYVSDIYFNKDTKMFTLAYKSFFLRRKELEFKAEDVVIPFTPRMFVTHVVKGRSCFIEFEEFRDKEIYKHMAGYDKPLDLTGGNQDQENKTKAKKKKKFGLFEDEDIKRKPEADKTLPPELLARQAMYDDDDDDWQHVTKEKQKNKMH